MEPPTAAESTDPARYRTTVFLRRDARDLVTVLFQQVEDYHSPQWPNPAYPQQYHLDVMVDDIEEAEKTLLPEDGLSGLVSHVYARFGGVAGPYLWRRGRVCRFRVGGGSTPVVMPAHEAHAVADELRAQRRHKERERAEEAKR